MVIHHVDVAGENDLAEDCCRDPLGKKEARFSSIRRASLETKGEGKNSSKKKGGFLARGKDKTQNKID